MIWKGFERNRFVVISCRVVKRKAEDLRGSVQQVERGKPGGELISKTENGFPPPAIIKINILFR